MQEPPVIHQREFINDEFEESMKAVSKKLTDGHAQVQALMQKKSLTKADKEVILSGWQKIQREVAETMPFIQRSFDESIEHTVSEAKGEIEAFYVNKIHATQAKEGIGAPLMLEDKSVGK